VLERRLLASQEICISCTSSESNEPIECESLDCPWMFERKKIEDKVECISMLEECIQDLTTEMNSSSSPTISDFDFQYVDSE
jgi:DNA polymerase zeta